jgi:peptidyl-prolyl cis-trans isomerase D
MIGTIRKHSKWLWGITVPAMIISLFLFFLPSWRNGGGGTAGGDFGSVYGNKITQQQYVDAFNEFKLFYLFHYGTWPEKKSGVSETEMERETYVRLLLIQKASDLGVHVGLDTAASMADQMLRSLGRKGQNVTLDEFTKQVLQPEGLTVTDFENFVRHDAAIQQLVQSVGSSGMLVTPQEAAGIYQHEHQELDSQIVFFSAKDYVPAVTVTPQAVAEFYTNYLAEYRLPDRVQVSYVAFELSNFLAQSKAEWAKTNFNEQVDAVYLQYGAQGFPDAKTPDAAKAEIRDTLIRQHALADARAQANEFAGAVFSLEPARAENLATVAKQKGLTVQTTTPFAAETGPQEFAAPEAFTKTAFDLTPDEPFANPVVSSNGVYVIALARQLPSEIPPLASIRARVAQDFQMQQAVGLARAAGTNFVIKLKINMAVGKSFASACVAAGQQPEILPPFSISTRELPELDGRAELNQLKQAAFTTPVGKVSDFTETDDGGFILFVQSQLPVDQAVMDAELPKSTESLRRSREQEAFNVWLNGQIAAEYHDLKFNGKFLFRRDDMN